MGIGRSKGFFYGLNLLGSSELIGSDLTGLGTYQQWSHFLPLGDPERGRFDWAHSYRVSTVDVKGESVPSDSRLRAGGEFSVRGYPTNSLGPQDEEGNALGGEFLVIANEELHLRLWKSFSSLLFFDVGNVWPTLGSFDWRFSASYGLGLRWSSPIGPLRLDWAVPVNPRPNDPGQTFYLGFGNVF
jgi:translocation and assembly module TamA